MAKQHQQGQGNSLDLGVLEDGSVVLQFPELIRQFTLTPAQAVSLGVGLIQNGTRGESLQRRVGPQPNVPAPRRKQ